MGGIGHFLLSALVKFGHHFCMVPICCNLYIYDLSGDTKALSSPGQESRKLYWNKQRFKCCCVFSGSQKLQTLRVWNFLILWEHQDLFPRLTPFSYFRKKMDIDDGEIRWKCYLHLANGAKVMYLCVDQSYSYVCNTCVRILIMNV